MSGSPFLYNRITLAIFSFSGNIPVRSDWFMIISRGCVIAGDKNLSSLVDIPSSPDDDLLRKLWIALFRKLPSIRSK